MASGSQRSIARATEIGRVATRHGFGYLFDRRRATNGAVDGDRGRRLREMLDELGPTFVKFGQLLSTRPDVVPPDIIVELQKLQDDVTPFAMEDVERVVAEELGLDVARAFLSFDPQPIAAASIGQVHRATLPNGDPIDCLGGVINDLTADSRGGVYFTMGGLFHVDAKGTITRYGENLTTNGIILSPDEKTLYVTNGAMVYAFDVNVDGSLTNQREFGKLQGGTGGDGSAVDQQGRVYVATGSSVDVFAADGKFIGTITGRALKRLMRMVSVIWRISRRSECRFMPILNIRHETKSHLLRPTMKWGCAASHLRALCRRKLLPRIPGICVKIAHDGATG